LKEAFTEVSCKIFAARIVCNSRETSNWCDRLSWRKCSHLCIVCSQSLCLVAIVKFGHAPELRRFDVKGSVLLLMLPKGYKPNLMLHHSDIL